MRQIVPIKIGKGTLYVESDGESPLPTPADQDVNVRGNRDRSIFPKGAEPTSALDDLHSTADQLRATIGLLTEEVSDIFAKAGKLAPKEWTLELNIGFKGKVSPIPVILSSEMNGAIKITAKWVKEDNKD